MLDDFSRLCGYRIFRSGLKLKGITEAELRNFPKGNMLVRMAKKSKLL